MGKARKVERKMKQLEQERLQQQRVSLASLPTPWYVSPLYGTGKLNLANMSHLQREKNCFMSLPEICGRTCVASMHGWLVMKDFDMEDRRRRKVSCFLLNPDTRQVIDLPKRNSHNIHSCQSCFLSAPPAHPDCMVLFIEKKRKFFLFYHLHQQDNRWGKHYFDKELDHYYDWFCSETMACINGTIYALTNQVRFATLQRKPCGTGLVVRVLNIKSPFTGWGCRISYMVESFGEIYYVVIYLESLYLDTVIGVEVFKLNFSKEEWVKVESLGKTVFILSDYGSMSLPATDNSQIQGNTIYIIYDDSVLVYGVDDESLSVFLPFPELGRPFAPFWFMSSTKRSHDTSTSIEELEVVVVEEVNNNTTATVIEANDEEESIGGANWIELPMDILCTISTHLLFGIDYVNFRLVCKAWKESVLPIPRTSASPICTTKPQCPWLLFSNREQSKCCFLDPVSNFRHCVDMPELLGARICFSKDGWLLLSRGEHSMFFFNPFNSVTIKLPDLPKNFLFCGLSFSSLPTLSDCIVFCIESKIPDCVEICYLRKGEDAWTWVEIRDQGRISLATANPVFYDGAFHCLGHKRHLGVFDLKDGKGKWTVLETPQPYSASIPHYLVEVNGDFLSVSVDREGSWVRVHKLDRLSMNWARLDCLEDEMIFVCRSTSISLKAATEAMQNKIYFPISFNSNNNHVFYSLDTGRWHSLFSDYSREDISNTKEQLHCTWIQPTLTWAS